MFALSNLISLLIQNLFLKIDWLFPTFNAVNFDRSTIFVGPVVSEIWVGRQEKNKMVSVILFFGRAYFFTIGGKTDQQI